MQISYKELMTVLYTSNKLAKINHKGGRMDKEHNKKDINPIPVAAGIATGAAIGAAAVLLSDKKKREKIKEMGEELKSKGIKIINETQKKMKEWKEEAKEKGEEVKEDLKKENI